MRTLLGFYIGTMRVQSELIEDNMRLLLGYYESTMKVLWA